MLKHWRSILACLVWLIAISLGFVYLLNYESDAGESKPGPRRWNGNSALHLASPLYTLIMVVHPHCPCTQASISELSQLMTHCQSKLRTYVLFVHLSGFPEGWDRTDLWTRTAAIPGVSVISDKDGREARNLDALTSGQCYLYDPQGQLRFAGGITNGRGHEGDNAGVDAIQAIVNRDATETPATQVFGCPLFSKSEGSVPTCQK